MTFVVCILLAARPGFAMPNDIYKLISQADDPNEERMLWVMYILGKRLVSVHLTDNITERV